MKRGILRISMAIWGWTPCAGGGSRLVADGYPGFASTPHAAGAPGSASSHRRTLARQVEHPHGQISRLSQQPHRQTTRTRRGRRARGSWSTVGSGGSSRSAGPAPWSVHRVGHHASCRRSAARCDRRTGRSCRSRRLDLCIPGWQVGSRTLRVPLDALTPS